MGKRAVAVSGWTWNGVITVAMGAGAGLGCAAAGMVTAPAARPAAALSDCRPFGCEERNQVWV